MRIELSKINGERRRFSGRFVREGKKRGYRGRTETTILLVDIRDSEGKIVSDHLWFNLTQQFDSLILAEGEVVSFHARVTLYEKGYKKDTYDYRLSRPTRIVGHGLPDWDDYDGPPEYALNAVDPEPTPATP